MNFFEIKNMPKGELHVHLNGLVSINVIKELLKENNSKIPTDFCLERDLTRRFPVGSLAEYLRPWEVLRLIPNSKQELTMLVESAFLNLKKENVHFVELRNSVIYIASLNNISIKKALAWLIDDIDNLSDKYGIKAGLIMTVNRGGYALEHLSQLLEAYKCLKYPQTVIGVDLAGNEDVSSSKDLGYLFKKARYDYDLGVTIHAGETGNIENVADAINNYGANRIGHGTAIIKSKGVMNLVKEKDICIEVCLISNRLTNAIDEDSVHPVSDFIRNNIPFVLCSDNPSIHVSGISKDYMEFIRETKNISYLNNMFEEQRKYSFIKGL